MRKVPDVIGATQPIIRIVELLPAPFGPRNPNASPRSTSKSMPSTAVNVAEALGQAVGDDQRPGGERPLADVRRRPSPRSPPRQSTLATGPDTVLSGPVTPLRPKLRRSGTRAVRMCQHYDNRSR